MSVISGLDATQNFILNFRSPVYFKLFPCTGDSRIKDVMGNKFVDLICNHDFKQIYIPNPALCESKRHRLPETEPWSKRNHRHHRQWFCIYQL